MGFDVVEDTPGDRLVPPCDQPPAALVAPSKVKTKSNMCKAIHHGVVHLDTP